MKILLLVHRKLQPPPAPQPKRKVLTAKWRTEYDVREALKRLGHDVIVVGVDDNIAPLVKALTKGVDVIFNLLEEFAGEAVYDHSIVSFLELMGYQFTGCHSRGLALAKDKATAKKIVAHHGILTPAFFVVSRKSRAVQVPKGLRFPLIVKYLTEEASLGLTKENVVHSQRELRAQISRMLDSHEADLLVEEYVSGREIYVGVLGNDHIEVLPARELHFGRLPSRSPRIASRQIKWSASYRKKFGIFTRTINPSEIQLHRHLRQIAVQITQSLRINGYARLDFRIDSRGQLFFIEANPNPQICMKEDFADAAQIAGWSYDELIQRIVDLGRSAEANPPMQM